MPFPVHETDDLRDLPEPPKSEAPLRPMKILMASHYFASHNGGVEIIAEELFRRLTAKKQEVVWIAGSSTPPPEPNGPSRPIGLPILNFVEEKIGVPFPIPGLAALSRIRAAVNGADVVILHDCLYLSNIATFFLARLREIPVLIIQHIGSVPYKNPFLNALMRIANSVVTRPMLSRAQQVVYYSETTRNFFGSLQFKRPPEMILNGVDTDLFHPPESAEARIALRRQYQLPEDRPVILFVGRFVEKKGISIMKRMVEQRPGYIWAFAGWGPLDPSGWSMPNVRVYSDLRGPSIAPLYRACDLFVLPSTGEGFPLVVQEALASGLPVVCGSETASADTLMGSLVQGLPIYRGDDAHSAEGFLSAVDNLVASSPDPAAAEKRRAFAVSRYSWNRAAAQYVEALERLLPVKEI